MRRKVFFKQDQITSRYGEDLFESKKKLKLKESKRLSILCLGINKSIISVLHGIKKNFLTVCLMEHFDLN